MRKNRTRSRRIDWDRHVPVGLDGRRERNWGLLGLFFSLFWSVLHFLAYYSLFLNDLLDREGQMRAAGFVNIYMPDFDELLVGNFGGFTMMALCMLPLALYHYLCHYRGSRSIYLMRRLPDRWELHRRCLALPALGLALSVLIPAVLVVIYFCIYQFGTPYRFLEISKGDIYSIQRPYPWQGPLYRLLYGLFCA